MGYDGIEITGETLATLPARTRAKWNMEQVSHFLREIAKAAGVFPQGQPGCGVKATALVARKHAKDALTALKEWEPETRGELTRRAVRRAREGRGV